MSPRVVMLVTNDALSDPRVDKEAVALAENGFEVTVIAWDRAGEAPSLEQRGAVTYERVGPRASYGGGVKNLGRFRGFWRAAASRAVELAPDVVHCHDLDTAPAGLRVLARTAAAPPRLVLDMHELYMESGMVPRRGLMGVLARAAVRLVERRAYPRADAIVVASPGIADYHAGLGAANKLVIVENAPEIDRFCPHDRPAGAPFAVGYFGQKRYPGSLRLLMEVVQEDARLHALLAGGGTAAVEIARFGASMERVEVSGRFDYTELPALYARCDAVYAVYGVPFGNVNASLPVKVMEAMACALPVIVDEGTWYGEYVTSHRIGIAVPAGDRDALLDALRRLAGDAGLRAEMGRRGRALVEGGLNWGAASARLVDLYRSFF